MKTVLKMVALLSLLLNLYYYAVLAYIRSAFDSYQDRIDQFPNYFGHIPATNTLLFLAIFTLVSIILVGIKDIFKPSVRVVFAVVQAVAFAFYLWQLM